MAPIRLGTRGSPLALAQAHQTRDRLIESGVPEAEISITVFKTSGDRIQDRPLSEVGGKGLFTKELEDALLGGHIDAAVHSMKDMATQLPAGLGIGAVLPRADVRDAFVSLTYGRLTDLPKGALFGTSSIRRQAQLLRLRPDLRMTGFRGNVQTRLKKLADGVAEATLLAVAGLNRLGMSDVIRETMAVDMLLPAPAQGAVAIEIRTDDEQTATRIGALNHEKSHLETVAERAFLGVLDGSCRTPIAALAVLDGGVLTFRGEVISPDGVRHATVARSGAAHEAARMGADAGREILVTAGTDLFGARD